MACYPITTETEHRYTNIFKRIFFNENVNLLIKISLRFVSECPINNMSAIV